MKRRIYIFFIFTFSFLTTLTAQDSLHSVPSENLSNRSVIKTDSSASNSTSKEGILLADSEFKDTLLYAMFFSTTVLLFLTTKLSSSRKKMRLINEQLKTKNKEIRDKNETLRILNDKNQVQHREINAHRIKLEELNRVKDKMFSIIAHDFRSPLNTIQGVLNLLHLDVLSSEELKSMLPHLSRKMDHSISLLDNLLNWARTQMNGLKINKTTFVLVPEIDETIGIMSQLARQKNIKVHQDLLEDETVYADPDMIQLVVRNLLSNAIKFTRTGGTIKISAQRQDDAVILSVCDTGVGMDEATLKKIFEQTGHTTKGTDQEKGTGLGLILCNEFVRRNEGKIWVESKIDEGTTFFFSVPVAQLVATPYV